MEANNLTKIIIVTDCMVCPYVGKCVAWKKLTAKQRFILKTGIGVGTFILKDCPLEDSQPNNDLIDIQTEMLELTIKAGRRLMHDFKHMLNEVPEKNMFKKDFEERGKIWEDIFYPDNGPKNYRSSLHQTIINLNVELNRVKEELSQAIKQSTE